MSEPAVDISVVIPTYGRIQQLNRCLQGFRHIQNEGFRYEILVVDDGSPKPIKPQLAEMFSDLPICWLRQDNQGPATARNFGANRAQGRLLAFIDDDCLPEPAWLVALWQANRREPTALIGGCTVNGLPLNLYAEASQLLVSYLYDYFAGKNGRFFTSNNFAMSRQLFIQLGGFNESMPLAAGEDREYCDRWQRAGLPMLYVPDAKIRHYHQMTLTSFWRQHFNYGRGAKQFRRLQVAQNLPLAKLEPFSFYVQLVMAPLKGKRPFSWQKISLMGLMALSQLANALGYFFE